MVKKAVQSSINFKQEFNNFSKIFRFSFKHALHTYSIYIFLILIITITGIFSFVAPAVIARGDNDKQDALNSMHLFSMMIAGTVGFLIVLFCSMIAENICNIDERVFVLTRPIRRSTYIISKFFTSLIIGIIIIIAVNIEFVLSNAIYDYNMFYVDANNNSALVGNYYFILLLVFSCLGGSIFRYFIKNRFTSVILMVFIIIVNTLVNVFWTKINYGSYSDMVTYYVIIPSCVFIPCIIFFITFGWYLISKENIRI